ncbi:2-dehydropantoate 2-reductase [Glycomyces sp. NPDC046736]|uniref:2-dehydropantoate 2-reductase n=1 Tax=Glycomyces sp. NPDC046736 TaxID=3155615 RepID=UPI0033FEC0B0
MICVYGAGSVGCYVGGRLAAAGADVTFVGREPLARETAAHGLTLTGLDGTSDRVEHPRYTTDAEAAADADLVLLTVKSGATAEAAECLAELLRPGAIVVSLQNGLRNTATLREALPDQTVLAGTVEFNVARLGEGRFHRGTAGAVLVQDHPGLAAYADALASAGVAQRPDLGAVQAAKLLINLNNSVNALSGLPLRTELAQRDFRRCLALAHREALGVLRAARLDVGRTAGLPPGLMPVLLRLPDKVFARAARRALAVDRHARSSMWDDLEAGRPTEVDHINGEVTALAAEHGRTAPVNAELTELVHAAEEGGRRDWPGPELLDRLKRAAAS